MTLQHIIEEIENIMDQASNDDDIGNSKAVTAANSLQPNYPHAAISALDNRMDERQLFERVKDYDLVMDCSDNFETRFIVNDICIEANGTGKLGS